MVDLEARTRVAAVCAGVVLSLVPDRAESHVGYPATERLLGNPSASSTQVALTSYGLLVTRSPADEWRWLCPRGVGYDGFEDPPIVVTLSGLILVGSVNGLFASHDDGCDFRRLEILEERQVIDLATDPSNSSSVVALLTSPVDGGFVDSLWETTDEARTWQQVGADFSAELFTLTISVSPADPSRIYVTGMPLDGSPGILFRSDDRGLSWSEHALPAGNLRNPPSLLAAHPSDPDYVIIRVDGNLRVEGGTTIQDPDLLLASGDAGQTWTQGLAASGEIYGAAFEPSGGRMVIAVADPRDGTLVDEAALGLWRSAVPELSFERVLDGSVTCAAWDSRGIIACADPMERSWDIGVSADDGATFAALFDRSQLAGPLECSTGSLSELCASDWPSTCEIVTGEICEGAAPPVVDAGVLPFASTSPVTGGDPPSGVGCGACHLNGAAPRSRHEAAGLVLVCLLTIARRRSRSWTHAPR